MQADRNMPVHLLEEIVGEMPDGIYLRSLKQENQSVLLTGVAQSQERVSDLLRSLSTKTKWLVKPELVEIVAASAAVSSREQRRVSNFTIRAGLNRPTSGAAKSSDAARRYRLPRRPLLLRLPEKSEEPWIMATSPKINVDLKSVQDKLKTQFTGLDPNDPSQWPAIPRNLLFVVVCVAVMAALWFAWLKSVDEELVTEQAREQSLRDDYRKKLVQAVNLDALKKQLEQVQQYVSQLEKQLPSKAEMDALLSDINQAGLGRSLQFELFRPGQVSVKEYYAELADYGEGHGWLSRHWTFCCGYCQSLSHCDAEQSFHCTHQGA